MDDSVLKPRFSYESVQKFTAGELGHTQAISRASDIVLVPPDFDKMRSLCYPMADPMTK